MKQKQAFLALFMIFSLGIVSCTEPISKDEAKRQIDAYFASNQPTFTFYVPVKDNFLWQNSISNNGDSNYIKNNSKDAYCKYCFHLIDNLKIFGALNYHFTKEPDGCRIHIEFTDKFKSIIKDRSHWDNDSNGEHITIVSGLLRAKIVSIEEGQYKDGKQASIVTINTEFAPNDIRSIFSTEMNEGKDIHKAYFAKTSGGWALEL